MIYAGFWKRFAALLIDAGIIIIGCIALGLLFSLVIVPRAGNDPAAMHIMIFMAVMSKPLGLILGWIYFAAMESSSNQGTPGKRALGIKVTDLAGNQVSFGKATGRYFGKMISFILLIGYLMVAFTNKKQGLHDMMAGCLVMNK